MDGTGDSPPPPPPPELAMVARAIERLVARNDQLAASADRSSTGGAMAAFEAARAPRIGVAQYLERVHRYAGLGPECYVVAYAYVDRAAHRRPGAVVASGNVHRLLLACLLVASKVLDDFHHNNAFFSRVGGVSNAEMNKLELELLLLLDFEVMVSQRVYEIYYSHLEKEMLRNLAKGKMITESPSENSADDDEDVRLPNGLRRDQRSVNGSRRHSLSPSRYSFDC